MTRPRGIKNVRSYLAIHKLEALGLDPIDEMLKTINELDELAKVSLQAYESKRGWSEKGDAGPAYLGNAIRAKAEKMAVYTKLSGYIYPTLSAVGIKDIRKEEDQITSRVVSAIEVRQTILNDPFAMNGAPILTVGNAPTENEIIDVRPMQTSDLPSGISDGQHSQQDQPASVDPSSRKHER